MVDTDLKSYLIEVNKNPCLSTLSPEQLQLISKLLKDTFELVVEPFFGLSKSLKEAPTKDCPKETKKQSPAKITPSTEGLNTSETEKVEEKPDSLFFSTKYELILFESKI